MKKTQKLFVASVLTFALGLSAAFAGPCKEGQIEGYAHPTLFNAEAQTYVDGNKVYQTGGKIYKTKNRIGIKNKDSVYVDSWAKDVLSLIKERSGGELFNPKMPILRSEMAVVLSEGFDVAPVGKTKKYSDVAQDYWANEWIARATNAGVMIGYPDKTFKPDQPITKAEVFAVIAQLIDVPTDRSLLVPEYNGKTIEYIPSWAIGATKEVVNSELLDQVPDQKRVNDDMYLSKEQVAYLIGTLRTNFATSNGKLAKDKMAPDCVKSYKPVYLNVKLCERISAKTSNIGQKFAAVTTKEVEINNTVFPAGSKVKGEVVAVKRPGLKNPGFIKVKFLEIKNGDCVVEFPKNITEAQANQIKNPNFIARLFGAPFSAAARIIGVSGRTVGTGVNIAANGVEEIGDELSDTFVDTLCLQPVAGVKRFGSSFITLGKGIYDTCKNIIGGVFGVIYEIGDEIVYLIVPSLSNSSSLNPGEELLVIF